MSSLPRTSASSLASLQRKLRKDAADAAAAAEARAQKPLSPDAARIKHLMLLRRFRYAIVCGGVLGYSLFALRPNRPSFCRYLAERRYVDRDFDALFPSPERVEVLMAQRSAHIGGATAPTAKGGTFPQSAASAPSPSPSPSPSPLTLRNGSSPHGKLLEIDLIESLPRDPQLAPFDIEISDYTLFCVARIVFAQDSAGQRLPEERSRRFAGVLGSFWFELGAP